MSSTLQLGAVGLATSHHDHSDQVIIPQTEDVVRQLRIRQLLCIGLALIVSIVGFYTYQSYAYVVNTVGKDAVPSIVAAEKIRMTLASAHTQIVNVFLTKEAVDGSDGKNTQAYVKSIAQAHDYLLVAAQNITYGDEERKPILELMTQLSAYERLVGMALAKPDQHQSLLKADTLMREHILPAVVALDDANFKHLSSAYTEGEHKALLWLITFLLLSALLVLVYVETQMKLYATFKRMLNPAIAAGLAIFIVSALLFAVKAGQVVSEVRSAKEDAFDSVHALSQAKALAYTANAQESVYLLLSKSEAQQAQTTLFQETAKKLFALKLLDVKQLPSDLKSLKGNGLLAEELANITYDGEENLARDTLKGWLEYVRIDAQIRQLETAGQHDAAIALCLGTQVGQSDWAFDQFMKSLTATLNLNEQQFALAVSRAFHALSWLWMLLLAILFAPVIGIALGIQQRLAEFRE